MQIKSAKKLSLLELLGEMAPESSKNTLRSWIEKGRVTIDGKKASRANQIVEKDQEVALGIKKKFLPMGLKILYEDRDLVVIEKPIGLLSVATDIETVATAHALLKRQDEARTVYPIHRLDKDTSGLLVFAYSLKAKEGLKAQLEKRTMSREYRALVHGHPTKGIWKCGLRENKQFIVHVCPPSKGKVAVTHYEILKKRGEKALLKLNLETGRKHQIRVQAAHAGYPVVGDSKYGLAEDAGKRLHLHAVHLTFIHPISQKEMVFSSPTPF